MILNNVLFNERLSRLMTKCLINSLLINVSLRQEPIVAWDVAGCLGSTNAIKIIKMVNYYFSSWRVVFPASSD